MGGINVRPFSEQEIIDLVKEHYRSGGLSYLKELVSESRRVARSHMNEVSRKNAELYVKYGEMLITKMENKGSM